MAEREGLYGLHPHAHACMPRRWRRTVGSHTSLFIKKSDPLSLIAKMAEREGFVIRTKPELSQNPCYNILMQVVFHIPKNQTADFF